MSVASDAHRSGRVNWNDPGHARGYMGFRVYSQSKLMNIMFAFALARRVAGSGVTSTALHPGVVRSGFWDHGSGVVRPVFALIKRFGTISSEEGARTPVYLATAPEVQGLNGIYFARCQPAPTTPAARDEAAQERLWTMTQAWLAPWLDGADAPPAAAL
ncbi:NAD(P)-dependent dehydrogenase (short-subunit alcohol dehydrogenase family) [Deinococcus metalli]|uniref:NAD(P)-dependent dehydrogenase (Short-subunit alcohol dehydrogenase family) n=1 Tax=Deinococcus metalli TaxID=1141878 RepID=A0A7W8KHV0_9DEIO|nr:hypothetical protein [Deinococcus metalli]MBB5376799.1 NAD(P)-dependent dehydrogenase (short-subunit alcohol dehydrogenase family) [Deinococcus metalli]GHF45429.1 hypothetical protein GCM10017781_22280 [Deinococcus metalli]